jgi:hypothetical protein
MRPGRPHAEGAAEMSVAAEATAAPRRVQHEHPTIRTAANAIDEKAATNTTAAEIAALLSDHTIRSSNHLEERI